MKRAVATWTWLTLSLAGTTCRHEQGPGLGEIMTLTQMRHGFTPSDRIRDIVRRRPIAAS